MNHPAKKAILGTLLVLEVLVFLLPTTLLYAVGLAYSVALTFTDMRGHFAFSAKGLELPTTMLFAGYALLSLWWLVFNFRSRTIKELPKYVWFGLFVGIFVALLFSFPFLERLSSMEMLKAITLFGGGPLLVLTTLLSIMYYRNKHSFASQDSKSIT